MLSNIQKIESNDCAVVAIAQLLGIPYDDAWKALELQGRKQGRGAMAYQILNALRYLDVKFERVDCLKPDNSKYTAKTINRKFICGRYLLLTTDHAIALIDGKIQDWTKDRHHRILAAYYIDLPDLIPF